MKCISVRQPWAELIVRGIKDVENRVWPTAYRGPLLIHAGLKSSASDWEGVPASTPPIVRSTCCTGAIIGMVQVVDCTKTPRSQWHMHGSYGWYLTSPCQFAEPIPYVGWFRLFDVPDSLVPEQYRPRT